MSAVNDNIAGGMPEALSYAGMAREHRPGNAHAIST